MLRQSLWLRVSDIFAHKTRFLARISNEQLNTVRCLNEKLHPRAICLICYSFRSLLASYSAISAAKCYFLLRCCDFRDIFIQNLFANWKLFFCSFSFLFITLSYRKPQLSLCYFFLFLTFLLLMHTLVTFLFYYISHFSKNIVMDGQIWTRNILVYFYHFKFVQSIIPNLLKKVYSSFLNNWFKIV